MKFSQVSMKPFHIKLLANFFICNLVDLSSSVGRIADWDTEDSRSDLLLGLAFFICLHAY